MGYANTTTHFDDPKNVISFLREFGHLRYPEGKEQDDALGQDAKNDATCNKLTLQDEVVKNALRSFQKLDANCETFALGLHGRDINPDGDLGPATKAVMGLDRCGHVDYGDPDELAALPAVGSGNWKRCHGVGEFHSASITVHGTPGNHLLPVWPQVQSRIVEAFAETGLLFHFDGRSPINIDWRFVDTAAGWIGLAQLVNNATCNTRIWCQYQRRYTGGNTQNAVITQWTTLGKHELIHNCGIGHTNGGVMNPSIINGLPISLRGDVVWPQMAARFGGVPVPINPDVTREMVLAWKYPSGQYVDITKIPVREIPDWWVN